MPVEHKEGLEYFWNELDPNVIGNNKFLMAGNIISISDIEHYIKSVNVFCTKCGYKEKIDIQDGEDFRDFDCTERKCIKCNEPDVVTESDIKGEVRRVLIQEPVGNKTTLRTIQGFLFDKVNEIQRSQNAHYQCILRSIRKKEKNIFTPMLDIYKITVQQDKKEKITDEDIELFKSITMKDLVESFCPKIKKTDDVKEGIIVSLVGGAGDNGIINMLMVGDPATGKTEMLSEINKIFTKSEYASGRSSSTAGLLAGVDNLPDGTRVARFGPIINCNNGVVALDEMDKMNVTDQSGLHEAMSKHTFSLKKVGINMTLPTYTIIIGAANPVGSGRWNDKLTIIENIRLKESLLSRFGLIFLLRDKPDAENDRLIFKSLAKTKQDGFDPKLDTKTLKKFIEHARSINPSVTDEALAVLEEWFLDLRSTEQQLDSVAIDHRTANDLLNLAISYARIRSSDVVEEQDSKNAINILKKSLHSLGMHTPGERSESESLNSFYDKDTYVQMVFRDEISFERAVHKLMQQRWFRSKEVAQKTVKALHAKGLITEVSDGVYKWV